jgi:VanZ family protein
MLSKISQLLQNKTLFKVLFTAWFIISFGLFVMPSEHINKTVNMSDKVAHILVFAAGMFCLTFTQKNQKLVQNALWLIFYGIAVEFIQANLPISFHRGAELLDAVADTFGVLIGFGVVKTIRYWLVSKS